MRKLCVLFCFTCGLLCPLLVLASPVDVELAYYSKASHLANTGKYQQAAQQWHRLTIVILSSEAKLGRKRMWQYAGLSEALAAIAADKANNAITYQYWADSTRYLMTGGTNWEQMRKKLHRRYEYASTLLSTQLQVTDLASGMDSQWEQDYVVLRTWEQNLGVFRFQSPKLGLSDSSQRSAEVAAPVTYVPVNQSLTGLKGQGGKKLSGLNNAFSQEQQFVPVNVEAIASEIETIGNIPANKENLPSSISVTKASNPLNEQETKKAIRSETAAGSKPSAVSRKLSVGKSSVIVETAPVMSKGFIVSADKLTVNKGAVADATPIDPLLINSEKGDETDVLDPEPTTVQQVVEPFDFKKQSSMKSQSVKKNATSLPTVPSEL